MLKHNSNALLCINIHLPQLEMKIIMPFFAFRFNGCMTMVASLSSLSGERCANAEIEH
jgi:hypothetical protein